MKEKLQELEKKITTRFAGRKIYYYPSLPSTMDTAREKALKKEIEGAGGRRLPNRRRGRKNRPWCFLKQPVCINNLLSGRSLGGGISCAVLAVFETIKTPGVKIMA